MQREDECGILLSEQGLGKVETTTRTSAGQRNVVSTQCQGEPRWAVKERNGSMDSMGWEDSSAATSIMDCNLFRTILKSVRATHSTLKTNCIHTHT